MQAISDSSGSGCGWDTGKNGIVSEQSFKERLILLHLFFAIDFTEIWIIISLEKMKREEGKKK